MKNNLISLIGILFILLSCNHNSNDFTRKGKDFFDKEKYEEAIVQLNSAIAINPNDALAYYYRGQSYFIQNNFEKAKPDFDKAIAMNNKAILSDCYCYRGCCNFNAKNYKEAISDLSIYIQNNQTNPEAYFYRGNSFLNINDYDKATIDLLKSIKLDSSNAQAYFILGQLKIATGLRDEGVTYISKAINLGNKDAQDYYNKNCATFFELQLVGKEYYGSFAKLNFQLKNLLSKHTDKFWITATLRDKKGNYLAGEENLMWDNIRPNGIGVKDCAWENINLNEIGEVILVPNHLEIEGENYNLNISNVDIKPNNLGIKVTF